MEYFNLDHGAQQGDPIAMYLFIIALEMMFIMIKKNDSIKPLELCDSAFLYSAYADDISFFLQDEDSVKALFETIQMFSRYSDLKPNYSKCEVAGIGTLKGAFWALCGLKSVDLTQSTIKILGLHYSYNTTLKNENIKCLKKGLVNLVATQVTVMPMVHLFIQDLNQPLL